MGATSSRFHGHRTRNGYKVVIVMNGSQTQRNFTMIFVVVEGHRPQIRIC